MLLRVYVQQLADAEQKAKDDLAAAQSASDSAAKAQAEKHAAALDAQRKELQDQLSAGSADAASAMEKLKADAAAALKKREAELKQEGADALERARGERDRHLAELKGKVCRGSIVLHESYILHEMALARQLSCAHCCCLRGMAVVACSTKSK